MTDVSWAQLAKLLSRFVLEVRKKNGALQILSTTSLPPR